MTTEELRVLIRTVADTAGARQTQQALGGVQQQAAQTGRAAATATAGLTSGFNQSARSILQFAGAIGLATSGAALAHQAVGRLAQMVTDASEAFVTSERITRAAAAAYGSMAGDWVRFAERMSAATGQSRTAILEAALSARTLSANYGLSIEQTRRLIQISADLANIRGIGIAESFERVQSAIRGEAEASEYLGLTLNDTFIKNNAMNGSLKNTFETMSDQQKAQVRYAEVLRQTSSFQGLAASSANTLEGAQRKAAVSSEALGRTVGGILAPALKDVALAQDAATIALKRWVDQFARVPTPQELRERAVAIEKSLPMIGPQPVAPIRSDLIGAVSGQTDAEALRKSLEQQGIIQRIEAARVAQAAATAARRREEQQARRLRELNETNVPAQTAAQSLREIAFLDQIDAAHRDLAAAMQAQNDLARESIQLAGQEAQIKLGMLDVQQRMAAAQRDMTEQQARARLEALPASEALEDLQRAQQLARLIQQTRSDLAEDQLRGRLAALPATEALEDLRFAQQRAALVLQDRQAPAAERAAARREIREVSRAEPGVALAALDAQRQLAVQGRGAEREGIQQQIQDLADQRALATAQIAALGAQVQQVELQRGAERLGLQAQLQDIAAQRALAPIQAMAEQNQLLAQVAAAITAERERTVRVVIEGGIAVSGADGAGFTREEIEAIADSARARIFAELTEANGQAHVPPVIQQSGVRRN